MCVCVGGVLSPGGQVCGHREGETGPAHAEGHAAVCHSQHLTGPQLHSVQLVHTGTVLALCCCAPLTLCVCVCVQLLQQQAVASGHASVSPVSPYQQPPPTFTMSGLLSPTSPTHPSPIPSVGGLGTSLASPGLPTLPSLTNGLPTLSPNGLGSSTDPLQSPLHRCVCVCVCVCVQ